MQLTRTALRTRLDALRGDARGLALIEFAMSLPVLLALGLYGIEAASLTIAHLRVSQIAAMTADNASRVRTSIDEADINELFTGVKLTGSSIDFAAHSRIILSDVEQGTATTTKQWIRWQRCTGAKSVSSSYGTPLNASGAAITNGTETSATAPSAETRSTMTAIGPSGNQIAASTGTAVMFVEVVYDYQPVVSDSLLGAKTISYTAAFNVRQRTDQVLKNGGNLSGTGLSTCNRFAA